MKISRNCDHQIADYEGCFSNCPSRLSALAGGNGNACLCFTAM